MKLFFITVFLFFNSLFFCISAQRFFSEFPVELSLHYGVCSPSIKLPVVHESVESEVFTVQLGYFWGKHGIVSGLEYQYSPYVSQQTIPLYYAFRTYPNVNSSPNSEDGLLTQLLGRLIPVSVQLQAGMSNGYINEFRPNNLVVKVNDNFYSSLDAMVMPTYYFGRLSFVLSLGGSYNLTKNFTYSDGTYYDGTTARYFGKFMAGLRYSL